MQLEEIMTLLRFRLSKFLTLIPLLGLAMGMGYRNHWLKENVVQLEAKVRPLENRCEKLTELKAIKNSGLSPFRPRHPFDALVLDHELQQFGLR
jgi:hypothetical protein